MSFSTSSSNYSLPASSVADQIRCLICADSSHRRAVPLDAQLIKPDQLFKHIADHLNNRDQHDMDFVCRLILGKCVSVDYDRRLDQIATGSATGTGGNGKQISSNNIPSSSTEREGPLENGTQQTVEQSLKTEEVNANWTMLEPSRSNRRCKIVANKNISKTLTNGRRPIVGKNGSGSGFSIKAASVGKSARKGNGQQRQSDRTLKEKTPKNAYFDCTCKESRGINKFSVACSQCKRSFHGKCVRVSRRESKRIPFWQCADCKKQQKEGDEEEIKLMFCVCREPYDNERFYVGCDGCGDWYHPECVQTTEEEINALGEKPYSCPGCKGRPQEWFDAKMTTKTERDD